MKCWKFYLPFKLDPFDSGEKKGNGDSFGGGGAEFNEKRATGRENSRIPARSSSSWHEQLDGGPSTTAPPDSTSSGGAHRPARERREEINGVRPLRPAIPSHPIESTSEQGRRGVIRLIAWLPSPQIEIEIPMLMMLG